jgi:hypothetical protein
MVESVVGRERESTVTELKLMVESGAVLILDVEGTAWLAAAYLLLLLRYRFVTD